ncbi:MAG TPA: type II CAAX endopeptidase family protein [Anaerolineaceae bacterium]|nr:type II CAAX endopeptidase family protein [Anaerolineaceae bacterium]
MASTKRSLWRQVIYSPDEDRPRAGWRLFVQFLLLLACMLVVALPLSILPLGGFWSNFILQLFTALGVTLSVWLARRQLDHRAFLDLGIRPNRRTALDLLVGFLIMGAAIGLIYWLETGLGWVRFEGFTWGAQTGQSAVSILLQVVPGTLAFFLLTAWDEELLFRGYQLQNLAEGLNLGWGVLISSVIFAVFHLANPNPSAFALIGLVAAGVFFAFAYLRTRRLWLPIGLHLGWNFFEGPVFGFPVSGLQFPTLLRQAEAGPDWLTGGLFGPEAGLVLLPALLLAAALVWLYTRSRSG